MSDPTPARSAAFGQDDFTMELRLCGDDGMVAGEYVGVLNRLRSLSGNPDTRRPYEGEPFACTGSAHLAGEHVRCTSPAHSRADAPLRVAAEYVGVPVPVERRCAQPIRSDGHVDLRLT